MSKRFAGMPLASLAMLSLLTACAHQDGHAPYASAAAQNSADHFGVKEIGSFHVGGRTATLTGLPAKEIKFTPTSPVTRVDPNGEYEVEQMYVQYVRLHEPYRRAAYPLLMIHGGGLAGVTWETKPDGGSSWQMYFLKNGHDVYIGDAVERGRASWARYPEIFTSEPIFRTKKEAWELFRIGPKYEVSPPVREAYPGTQFPVTSFDQFMKQGVPRWVTNDAPTQAAYDALVQKICPCVIVVHSQGSTFAYNAARKFPDRIKAIVGVEPSGALDPDKVDMAPLKGIPLLFVWGDKIRETPRWMQIQAPLKKMIAAQLKQGGVADEFDLPQMGILGNSHMMMMDRNSDQLPVGTLVTLPAAWGDLLPNAENGQGYGFGFMVRTSAGTRNIPGSIGDYFWGGAFGTEFLVDPKEQLFAIQLTQLQFPSPMQPQLRRLLREQVYKAVRP